MRHDYDYLTEQTRDTLTDNVKRAAAGWDKSSETIYQIIRGEKQDPYAYFRSFAEGLLAGGVSIAEYERDIAYLKEKHAKDGGQGCVIEAIRNKYHGFSRFFDRFMQSLSNDGVLDLEETNDLIDILTIIEPLLPKAKRSLFAHKVELENNGERKTENGKLRSVRR